MKILEEIKNLKSLFDQGAIDETEFKTLKKSLLDENRKSYVSSGSKVSQNINNMVSKDQKVRNIEAIRRTIVHSKRRRNVGFLLGITKIIVALLILGVLAWIFFPNSNTPSVDDSGNISTIESSADETASNNSSDDDKYVRDYIISHYFVHQDSHGQYATVKFNDTRAGWFGVMEIRIGSCFDLYIYETTKRNISLTYDTSNCSIDRGEHDNARLNKDNTLSIFSNGQEVIFTPLF